ncbi:hypothetical protein PRIC2_001914 [Phytophthora ramorum]
MMHASRSRGTSTGGTILIEWKSEQRAFEVLSDESMADQFPALEHVVHQRNSIQLGGDDQQTTDQDLAELIDDFESCWDSRDFSNSVTEMQRLRSRALARILATRTPLRWMPDFLRKWQNLLSFVGNDDVRLPHIDLVDYFQERMALARGWKLIGDIVQARSTLVKCFEMTRRVTEGSESQALRRAAVVAKKLLLEFVAFQTSLARNKELFERHDAPPHVLVSLSKEFWSLLRQAPLSVEVGALLVHSLMKQRQFAIVTRFLERSPFIGESSELALMHARALAYMGFYRQSIQIAENKDELTFSMALRAHCDRTKELLTCRERSDELLRIEKFKEAASSYMECLALVDPLDHKQTAALLFGHANALLGLEKLPAAIIDLRKSLGLDPTNKIASLRLKTTYVQLETKRIKKELSGTR